MTGSSKGIIFILSAPSGGGKTSLANALCKTLPNLFLSISVTTRDARPLEIDGREYFFKNLAEFENLIKNDLFLEYAKIYDHYYGTLKEHTFNKLSRNIDVMFDIDYQGVKSIKKHTSSYKIITIFILPPDLKTLKQRLIDRRQDSVVDIKQRLNLALEEISYAAHYDYIIINDDFNKALEEIQSIIQAERIKNSNFVKLQKYL